MKKYLLPYIALFILVMSSCSNTSEFNTYYEITMGINKGVDNYIEETKHFTSSKDPKFNKAMMALVNAAGEEQKMYEKIKEKNEDIKRVETLHEIVKVNTDFISGLIDLDSPLAYTSNISYGNFINDRRAKLFPLLIIANEMDGDLGDKYKSICKSFK